MIKVRHLINTKLIEGCIKWKLMHFMSEDDIDIDIVRMLADLTGLLTLEDSTRKISLEDEIVDYSNFPRRA